MAFKCPLKFRAVNESTPAIKSNPTQINMEIEVLCKSGLPKKRLLHQLS
jgi:hypothetical protein